MQTSSRKRVVGTEMAPLGLIHLRYIEMFQAILQAGTLTDAACLVNISQPAATKLLQQAERRLGFPLFVRVKGQWQLTSESELLKPQIGRIFDELRDLQRLISNIGRAEKQILRVVSTPTLANAIIPIPSPACASNSARPPWSSRPNTPGRCSNPSPCVRPTSASPFRKPIIPTSAVSHCARAHCRSSHPWARGRARQHWNRSR